MKLDLCVEVEINLKAKFEAERNRNLESLSGVKVGKKLTLSSQNETYTQKRQCNTNDLFFRSESLSELNKRHMTVSKLRSRQ